MDFSFPSQFASRYLADAFFADAYDALAPEERAQIKTAITRTIAVFTSCGCLESSVSSSHKTMRQGFSFHENIRPADWAVIFWDASCLSWTRILAAVLPAILAGVPNILACRVGAPSGKGNIPSAVLAAMELAGQEIVADMSCDEALSLLGESARQVFCGRAVLLGEDECLDRLAAKAARLGISVQREAAPVRIAVEVGLSSSVLQFAHPDIVFLPHDEMYAPFSALLCEAEIFDDHIGRAPLVLTPGQEAFWVWRDIDIAFFQEKTRSLTGSSK
jgi:hypothetical protein